jgi:cobalamin-dependent methionine synthase I
MTGARSILPRAPGVLADIPLELDADDILRFQGYRAGAQQATAAVLAIVDEALVLARELMEPRAVIGWAPVDREDDDALVAGSATLRIEGVRRDWGPVEYVAAAVGTIGEPIGRRIAELWESRELPLAMMLDSVASAAAERLASHLSDVICQEAQPLVVTHSISPGYGQWDLTGQRDLFQLCPAEAIGVRLNDACFMIPEKSVSLAVGAGPDARPDPHGSKCARCWMRDCSYRGALDRRRPRP